MTNSVQELAEKYTQEFKEVFCPITGCKAKFPAPWSQYQVDVNEKGMPVYECPVCHGRFTADDMPVNAVKVKDLKNTMFFWMHKNTHKCLFSVHSNNIFTDGKDFYIHVPILILNNPDLRMFTAQDTVSKQEAEEAFVELDKIKNEKKNKYW